MYYNILTSVLRPAFSCFKVSTLLFNSLIDSINKDGIILLHDCLPRNVYDQAVPRCQYVWNGDVWKAIVEARTLNNVDTYTCIADHGLGVIFNRKNEKCSISG